MDWDGNELLLSDVLGSDPNLVNQNIEKQVERDLLMHAVSNLSQREKTIMQLRFGLNQETEHTQKEVAICGNFSILYFTTGKKNHGTFKKRFRTGGIKYLCVLFTIVKHNRKEEKRQEKKEAERLPFYNIGAKIRKIERPRRVYHGTD